MGMRYRICNEMAKSVDAIARARDGLPADEVQIDVTDYTFDQLERAIETLLGAYALAVGTSILTTGKFESVLNRVVKFEERMQDSNLFFDVVIEGDADGMKRQKVFEEYLQAKVEKLPDASE